MMRSSYVHIRAETDVNHTLYEHTHTHVCRVPIIITLTDRLKHWTVQIFWVNQPLTVTAM